MATKKEMMVRELCDLRNAYQTLKGEPTVNFNECDIRREANNKTVVEIERDIKSLKSYIENEKRKQSVAKYWEMHPVQKQQLEDERKRLYEEFSEIIIEYTEVFNDLLGLIGLQVRGKYIVNDNFEVCLKDNTEYEFSIKYQKDWYGEKEAVLEVNYPCYGSFKVESNKDHIAYLQAMAAFCSNDNIKARVKELFAQIDKIYTKKRERVNAIDNELKNPICY